MGREGTDNNLKEIFYVVKDTDQEAFDTMYAQHQTFLNSDEEENYDDFTHDFEIDDHNIETDPTNKSVTKSMINRMVTVRSRNWFARNFRPVSHGGIRGSIFTLITGTVGAGVLSLPAVASYFGLLLAIILLVFFGLLTIKSYFCLNEAISHSGKRGYANLCAFYFGKKGGRAAVFIFVATQFMACICYSSLTWSLISSFIEDLGIHEFTKTINENGQKQISQYAKDSLIWRVCTLIPIAIMLIPVVLARNLSGLRYLSLVSFLIIMYTIVLAIVQTPMYYEANHNKPDYQFEPFVRPFKIKWIQGIATISMSYICHPLFFNVRKELILSDERRIKKVIIGAIGFMMTVYIGIVVAAYVSLGSTFQVPVFTERPKIGKNFG